ncbi:hypothetical protein [Nocardioides jiangxiensis]|uniref:Uncharacterized protein n=1 Tax=Nocardioides jiangxiensis TaxID=3064524 RepID=A0ABT9AZU0_9ACTN|nr:hypothetical protein [Nocardioides sp. WY-20]MDO7867985.1 hypothetical protein [Nocardioides sp. WY-20]
MTIHPIDDAGTSRDAPTRRERLEARRERDLVQLLETKDWLRGVHPVADFLDDAVRWTA